MGIVATYSCMFITVEIVSTHKLVDTENLVGDVEEGMFDEKEGVFHSHKHLHGQQPLCSQYMHSYNVNALRNIRVVMFKQHTCNFASIIITIFHCKIN